jgi:hypothetical protein
MPPPDEERTVRATCLAFRAGEHTATIGECQALPRPNNSSASSCLAPMPGASATHPRRYGGPPNRCLRLSSREAPGRGFVPGASVLQIQTAAGHASIGHNGGPV